MHATIQMDGHPVELNSSAGWLFVYRSEFGKDILPDIMPVLEGVLTFMIDFYQQTGSDEVTMDAITQNIDSTMIAELAATLTGMETITVLNIFWAMAKNANPSLPSPEDYFRDVECLELDVMIPELLRLIIQSSISSKNAKSLLNRVQRAKKIAGKSVSTV